jgi:hypothetical protein
VSLDSAANDSTWTVGLAKNSANQDRICTQRCTPVSLAPLVSFHRA